ncbi:Hepatoma-derived growth factor-related protein 2 [Sesbania bispinosa]|nr:Hepatoma-derived growth factor-related protein 2 [Sesbania bispinosa]
MPRNVIHHIPTLSQPASVSGVVPQRLQNWGTWGGRGGGGGRKTGGGGSGGGDGGNGGRGGGGEEGKSEGGGGESSGKGGESSRISAISAEMFEAGSKILISFSVKLVMVMTGYFWPPLERPPINNVGFQHANPSNTPAPPMSGYGVPQMFPCRPDIPALNCWRPT